MTKKPQKRDNEYYLERLRIDHPAIYADYQAKKFKNAAEAFVAAGLRKERSALDVLRTAWSKASAAEQDAFKALIGCVSSGKTAASAAIHPPKVVVLGQQQTRAPPASASRSSRAGRRHLPPSLLVAISAMMDQRGLTTGDIMHEIGRNPLNPSLGNALNQGWRVAEDMVIALENWVSQQTAP